MLGPAKTRVIVVDDHPLVREAVRWVVDSEPDMSTVAEAADAGEAMRSIADLAPDVVLMDVSIPGSSGVTLTERIVRDHPRVRVIGFSRHREEAVVTAMLRAGALGYVGKQHASSQLPPAIRTVAGGMPYLDPTLRRPPRPAPSAATAAQDVEGMTMEEEAVLRLVALSNTHEQIASQLSLTVRETMTLKRVAMQKNQLSSRLHLLAYARQRGWLSKEPSAGAAKPLESGTREPR